jgi:hypothetical protein
MESGSIMLSSNIQTVFHAEVKKLLESSFCARNHEFTAELAHKDGGVFDLKEVVGDGALAKFIACGSDLT